MEKEINLQKLKHYINESIISKENVIASKKKECSLRNLEMRNHHLTILEKRVEMEENLSYSLLKAEERLEKINLKKDLEDQIELKKSKLEEERAENLIESLAAKSKDREYFRELEKNRNVKPTDQEFEKYIENHKEYLKFKKEREKEKEAVIHKANERSSLLKELQSEFESRRVERKKLEKQSIEIDLGLSLQKNFLQKEELKNLREEEQFLNKEVEEEEKSKKQTEKRKLEEQNILKVREEQIRLKENSKMNAHEREKEYVHLLTALLAEEEGLHRLRSEVASRKRREHYIVAQKILEERRRSRVEKDLEKHRRLNDEKELSALRNSVLEEEEKQLLLRNLPHLGPFLSPYVVERLARL